MFTGLVADIGTVRRIDRSAEGAALAIESRFEALELGESIAVDGACLTVARIEAAQFFAEASAETLAKTTLGDRARGDRVHLERALRADERLGGHIVTGHVDGVGRLVERKPLGDSVLVTFEVPDRLASFIAPKGSVALDGVSLTVNEVDERRFQVVLVPYTRKETTFDGKTPGARINVEADVLAKYVARLLGRPGVDGSGGGLSLETLRRQGYA